MVTDGYWTYYGDHFVRYSDLPNHYVETNILYINYN